MRACEQRPVLCQVSQRWEGERHGRPRRLSGCNRIGKAQELEQRPAWIRTRPRRQWRSECARHTPGTRQEPVPRPALTGSHDLHPRPRPASRADHRLTIEWPLRSMCRRRDDPLGQNVEARERARARPLGRIQRLADLEPPAATGHHVSHTHYITTSYPLEPGTPAHRIDASPPPSHEPSGWGQLGPRCYAVAHGYRGS
jgi:hypothetical protein